MVLTVLMIIIVWSFDSGMVSVFLSKKEEDVYLMALNVGSRYIRCLSVGMLVMTPMYLYRAAIQSLGHTNIPMVVGFCQFLTRVFAIGVLATFWSGAYFWTNVLAWAVSLPIVMVSYAYYIKDLQVKG
jgi:Na+-driven multidrug efflux pump